MNMQKAAGAECPARPALATLTMVTLTGRTIEERIPLALVPQEQALCTQLLADGVVRACLVTCEGSASSRSQPGESVPG
jgi:hypothetical protein